MAQRTEKVETEFEIVPEAITPLIVSLSSSTIQQKSGRSSSRLPEMVKEKIDGGEGDGHNEDGGESVLRLPEKGQLDRIPVSLRRAFLLAAQILQPP